MKRVAMQLRNSPVGTALTYKTYEKMMKIQLSKLSKNTLLLLCALSFASITAHAQDRVWPQFLGPQSNPVGTHARLADRWSKTENVEWSQEIPGRGWSSPIVTG